MSGSNGRGVALLNDRAGAVHPSANGSARHARETADQEIDRLLYRVIELLGEDPEREGLRDTPSRVRKSLQWLTGGYGRTPAEAVGAAMFEERHGSMVLVRDIELYSLCEHHMLPFFGRAHVAYVPDGRVVGLSKVARMVEVFARRLQVQERLTDELANGLEEVLAPRGVGVVIEASHMCMMMRGVQKQRSTTVTSAMRGSLADDAAMRAEFLQLAVTG